MAAAGGLLDDPFFPGTYTKTASLAAATVFSSASAPISFATNVSNALAVATGGVTGAVSAGGVCATMGEVKAAASGWLGAAFVLITARATSATATSSTIVPRINRFRPKGPVAWQSHPGAQSEACCFSNSMLSIGFWSSFDELIGHSS
jgi:hypothetical protein